MATPLKWNAAGAKWNGAGLLWNGVVASKSKSMSTTKAVIDFSSYAAAELGPTAQHIHDELTANAITFPSPPITMTAFQTLITAHTQAQAAKASRAKADFIAANAARDTLEVAMGELGTYVNTVAKGDPAVVVLSGCPSYETTHAADPSPPAAPANVRVVHGDVDGSVRIRYKPDRPSSTNEVQTNAGDPNNEAGWHHAGIFQGGKAVLTGLTPGTCVWIRVRTTGLKGVMGAWSDPAEIRVV